MNIFLKNIHFLSVLALGLMLWASVPVQAMFSARARATGLATRAAFAAKPSVLASGIAKPGMVKNISFRTPMQTPSVFNAWSNRVTSAFKPFYNYVRALFPAFAPSLVLAGGLTAYSSSEIYEKQILKTMLLNGDTEQILLWLKRNPNKIDIVVQVFIDNIVMIDNRNNESVFWLIRNYLISCNDVVNTAKIANAIVDKFVMNFVNNGHIMSWSWTKCNQSLKNKLKAGNDALMTAQQNRALTNNELKKIILFGTTETENIQSRGHIDRNLHRLIPFLSTIEDEYLLQMFVKALSQEAVFTKQGCVVLHHSMRPNDHFRYELFTRLAALVYDVPDKWFFLRFFNTSGEMLSQQHRFLTMGLLNKINKDYVLTVNMLTDVLQQQLLKGQYYENNGNYRELCLFVNSALFGCLNRPACCTADYVRRCHNVFDCGFSIKELMDAVGFKGRPEFAKICDELQELQIMNEHLSKYGRLLQIAVPEKHVDNLAYPASDSGPLKEVVIKGKSTTNIAAIIKAYQTQSDTIVESDDTETVMPLTTYGLLNPKNLHDVQMVVHYAGDQQEYAEYQRKFDAVMQKAYDLVCTLSDKERDTLVKGLAVIMQDSDTIDKK